MNQKLIVPVAFVVLALGAGIAIYFLLNDDSPRPLPPPAENKPVAKPGEESKPLTMEDFDVARIKPDPVRNERPPQPYAAPKATIRVVVSGRVVDETGAGVGDARVYFTGAGRYSGMKGTGYTDGDGNYQLLAWTANVNGKGDALARVSAEAPDGRIVVGTNASIADGAYAEMPELKLTPAARLEGQVVADTGEPCAGAEVTVRSAGPVQVSTLQGREPTTSRRQYVTTVNADHTGRFAFKHLPPGRYQVTAEGGYFGVNAGKPEVDLNAAAYAWQDVQLAAAKRVRGVLTDSVGNPVAGAVVRLAVVQRMGLPVPPTDDAPANTAGSIEAARNLRDNVAGFRDDVLRNNPLAERRALTDAAGRFGFSNVADGEYRLDAKLGEAEARLEGVKVDQPDYSMQIDVKMSVAGVVRDAETRLPVEFFDVRLAAASGEAQSTPFDRVSDDGRFEYHPAGMYLLANPTAGGMVRVSAPGYLPAAVNIGELREGESRRDLDIELKPLCEVTFDLTRDGRRLDFEPIALLFDDRLAFEASSDQRGRVRIPRVAPAKYTVKVTLADGTLLQGEIEIPARRKETLEVKLK